MRHSALQYFSPFLRFLLPTLALVFSASLASAQNNPFAPGWDLDVSTSTIQFGSVKHEDGKIVAETHSFVSFSGSIEENGDAKITVKLDSVNTNNDLRNVRMRFLFFETFKYTESVVSLKLTPEMAAGLSPGSQKSLIVPIDFSIHGVTNRMNAEILVAAENNDQIVVNSSQPLTFRIEEFQLTNNLRKIAETAGGFKIEPIMIIDFRLAFARRGAGETLEITETLEEAPSQAALETKGDFSLEECVGRFEILSETGNIYFAAGSARLEADSEFVLRAILDIVERCPGLRLQISGHTDSDGSAPYNQTLSERRAHSVVNYMLQRGIEPGRLFTAGFGEERPMVANTSAFNKSRNRRIEFSLYR